MPIPQQDVQAAVQVQQIAAVATEPVVRLVAGPGTGKSSTIEQRVSWLLGNGVNAAEIYAVSFTESFSSRFTRTDNSTLQPDRPSGGRADSRHTLHSLALRVLRAAGLLNRYPVDPLVLDQWELENIFDSEFSQDSGIRSKERREEIRRYNEAFWSTGTSPTTKLYPARSSYNPSREQSLPGFHGSRTQSYACVLPGEIVRQCVRNERRHY